MMDAHFIITRVKGLLLNIEETWILIKREIFSTTDIIKNYLLPLLLVPIVGKFIGLSIVGYRVPFQNSIIRVPIGNGLQEAVISLPLFLGLVYLLVSITKRILQKLGKEVTSLETTKIIVYSATPLLLSGIFFIVPAFSQLAVFGALYGIFVLYSGLAVMASELGEKQLTATVLIVISTLILWMILEVVLDEMVRVNPL